MIRILTFLLAALIGTAASAQAAELSDIQALMQEHREIIEASSRRTIGPAIDALADSGLPAARNVLEKWQAREMWQREADGVSDGRRGPGY